MVERLGCNYDSPKHFSFIITNSLYRPKGFRASSPFCFLSLWTDLVTVTTSNDWLWLSDCTQWLIVIIVTDSDQMQWLKAHTSWKKIKVRRKGGSFWPTSYMWVVITKLLCLCQERVKHSIHPVDTRDMGPRIYFVPWLSSTNKCLLILQKLLTCHSFWQQLGNENVFLKFRVFVQPVFA